MPLDINDLETPDQEKIRLGMEKKRADAEALVSTESNNNSGQPAIPKSSNFAGISPHDFNPYQIDQQGNIDYGASALRAIPEASVGYLGLKALQGAGEGLKRTISGENRGIKVQERQLKLQEKEGIKPTVTSESGIDPEIAQKMRFAEEQHIAKLRRDEELHQAKLQANGIKPNEINTVPPALAGSSVELPNTSTLGIQTAPTATAESALSMLPPGAPSVPQGSLPGAPNTQGVPGTLPANPPAPPAPLATPPATSAQQVIEQTTGTEPNPPVSNQAPIGEISTNPVESGSEANPLQEPGAEAGKTQLEATKESTNQEQPKIETATGEKKAAFPAETNTTKESGNLTNPAENPTQGGVEQIKKEVTPEKEFKSSTRIRMSKDDEERIKAIKEAGIATTHQLTREEIANQQMHPEMKKIVEEGNVKIESNPELKSEIEKLKAGHKIPNGFVWIPDMGSGDIHFINTHGFEKYRQFKKDEMGGKPIGEYALNPKDKNYNPDLREKIKKWSERNYPTSNIAGFPEMTGEQKGKAAPEETNFFSKMGKLKPVAKTIAGVGGVMMALTELAQAREEAKHGNPNSAIGRVAKVATGFAPLATFTNDTNSNEQEAMNRIRNQQSPIKGAVVPK